MAGAIVISNSDFNEGLQFHIRYRFVARATRSAAAPIANPAILLFQLDTSHVSQFFKLIKFTFELRRKRFWGVTHRNGP